MGEAKRRQARGEPAGRRRNKQPVALMIAVVAVCAVIAAVVYVVRFMPQGADVDEIETLTLNIPEDYDRFGISLGPEDAPLTVREFADFQCPGCAAFESVSQRLRETYVAEGKVRFVFFDLPLTSIHGNALVAARAARCAGDQEAFWAMHDALYAEQSRWSDEADPVPVFTDLAEERGIDGERLSRCLASRRHRQAVLESLGAAQSVGIVSTPTVVVGDQRVRGVPSWDTLKALMDSKLQSAPQ
ncbi:DsbA family protein [Marinobacteraceae bacterium S3BR75-40.1]